jgi:hypothetical protein
MQTELSYVRDQLVAVGRKSWPDIQKKTGVSERTMRRIVENPSSEYSPNYAKLGKLRTHFQTREKRRAA